MRWCWLALVGLTAGCAVQKAFVVSSADYNHDTLHAGVTRLPLKAAVPRTVALAKERGLFLVSKHTSTEGGLVLEFTAETERKWQPEGRFYKKHDSRYWFLLQPRRDGTTVRALGVPIFDGRAACAPLQQTRFEKCTPVELEGKLFTPLHLTLREQTRLDVSGGMEADMLVAIIGQLKREEADVEAGL